MKTKELIVAELLQSGHLKAEDAAILLTPTYQYVYMDRWPVINPYNPFPLSPYYISCGNSTYNAGVANSTVTLN